VEVGTTLGDDVGTADGADVGRMLGDDVGTADGADVGTTLGDDIGTADGADVGRKLGDDVGTADGADVGRKLGLLLGWSVFVTTGIPIGKIEFWLWNLFFELDVFGAGGGFSIGAIAGFVVGDFMIGFRDNFTCSSGIIPRFRPAFSSDRLNLTSEASME
jgi:hypothetical protein